MQSSFIWCAFVRRLHLNFELAHVPFIRETAKRPAVVFLTIGENLIRWLTRPIQRPVSSESSPTVPPPRHAM